MTFRTILRRSLLNATLVAVACVALFAYPANGHIRAISDEHPRYQYIGPPSFMTKCLAGAKWCGT